MSCDKNSVRIKRQAALGANKSWKSLIKEKPNDSFPRTKPPSPKNAVDDKMPSNKSTKTLARKSSVANDKSATNNSTKPSAGNSIVANEKRNSKINSSVPNNQSESNNSTKPSVTNSSVANDKKESNNSTNPSDANSSVANVQKKKKEIRSAKSGVKRKIRSQSKRHNTNLKRTKKTRKDLKEQLIENCKSFAENVETISGSYFCKNCEFVTTQIILVKSHVKTCLNKRRSKKRSTGQRCEKCDLYCPSIGALQKHFIENHQEKLYQCTKCEQSFETRNKFTNHIRRVHYKINKVSSDDKAVVNQEEISFQKHWKKNACLNFKNNESIQQVEISVSPGRIDKLNFSTEQPINSEDEAGPSILPCDEIIPSADKLTLSGNEEKLSNDEISLLKTQMMQHSQLLLTQFMLGGKTNDCRTMIQELEGTCDNLNVAPVVREVKRGMDEWEDVSKNHSDDKLAAINFTNRNSLILFPELVPKFSSTTTPDEQKKKSQSEKGMWLKSEEHLLKLALNTDIDKKKSKKEQAKLISSSLTGKSVAQIWYRLRNMGRSKSIRKKKESMQNNADDVGLNIDNEKRHNEGEGENVNKGWSVHNCPEENALKENVLMQNDQEGNKKNSLVVNASQEVGLKKKSSKENDLEEIALVKSASRHNDLDKINPPMDITMHLDSSDPYFKEDFVPKPSTDDNINISSVLRWSKCSLDEDSSIVSHHSTPEVVNPQHGASDKVIKKAYNGGASFVDNHEVQTVLSDQIPQQVLASSVNANELPEVQESTSTSFKEGQTCGEPPGHFNMFVDSLGSNLREESQVAEQDISDSKEGANEVKHGLIDNNLMTFDVIDSIAQSDLLKSPIKSTSHEQNSETEIPPVLGNFTSLNFLTETINILNNEEICEICRFVPTEKMKTTCCQKISCRFCLEVLTDIYINVCPLCNETGGGINSASQLFDSCDISEELSINVAKKNFNINDIPKELSNNGDSSNCDNTAKASANSGNIVTKENSKDDDNHGGITEASLSIPHVAKVNAVNRKVAKPNFNKDVNIAPSKASNNIFQPWATPTRNHSDEAKHWVAPSNTNRHMSILTPTISPPHGNSPVPSSVVSSSLVKPLEFQPWNTIDGPNNFDGVHNYDPLPSSIHRDFEARGASKNIYDRGDVSARVSHEGCNNLNSEGKLLSDELPRKLNGHHGSVTSGTDYNWNSSITGMYVPTTTDSRNLKNDKEKNTGQSAEEINRIGADKKYGSKNLQCDRCDCTGFRDNFNLKRHHEQMHCVLNIECKRCSIVFIDRQSFMAHDKDCYYFCKAPNCTFLTKKEGRMSTHIRKHKTDR